VRDYIIDLASGDAKAITPEGVAGVHLSPDGRSAAVLGADGKWGVWPLEGNGIRPIPGLDSVYYVTGWSADGGSLYAISGRANEKTTVKVYRVNVVTGKMDLWKTFGEGTSAGTRNIGGIRVSSDGNAYAYIYVVTLSQAYVVTGLK
jgi:WD40 repeat protein